MWSDLLGVERVGLQDAFFDLGGHSLIAVRLFARIRKTWGVDLPLATLFRAPTLEALAATIRDAPGPDPGAAGALRSRNHGSARSRGEAELDAARPDP